MSLNNNRKLINNQILIKIINKILILIYQLTRKLMKKLINNHYLTKLNFKNLYNHIISFIITNIKLNLIHIIQMRKMYLEMLMDKLFGLQKKKKK